MPSEQKIIVIPDGKICDYIDGKFRNDTPEEYVRQTIEKRLVNEHKYLPEQIRIEYTLQVGSNKPRADIVIWEEGADQTQGTIKLIIECKKETVDARNAKDGIAQLKSYMSVCPNCEWGMWTNSVQKYVFRKAVDAAGNITFMEYNDIPAADGNLDEVNRPSRTSLKNAYDDNLLFVFKTCHNHIYVNDGMQKQPAFFELLKVIFCKIEDERNIPNPLEFYTTSEERSNPDGQLTVQKRIGKIFQRVKKRHGKIFDANDEIKLSPRSLAYIVSELQRYSLLNTKIDIKGKAYEEIVGANLRGDRGEFFTPRNVMKMVVEMVNPQVDEHVLDSSCGTGGFLVMAMTHVIDQLEQRFSTSLGIKRENWDSDMPIYQPSSIVDIKPTPDGYISAKTKTNIGNLRVKENQILMTCSGTIGKVSFVSRTLANKIFSHDLLRIDCRKPDEAGYIYAFLKSKIGNKILLTNSYGAVITHIEPEHLATVPIPDAPTMLKKKIHDLIVRSYELRDESNDLIDQATALLIGELKLPDIDAFDVGLYKKAAPVDTFSVRLSEMSGRLDASYHVPIVDAIIEHLKRYAEEVTTVGDPRISREVILPGRFKRVYVDEGYGRVLIGGKQLSELDPSSKKYLSTAKHDKMLKKLEVHEGTTLITRSGTIGKITIVPKHWEHYIPSDHIIRVIPANKDIAGYLNIFLASDYGKVLITRFTYGSVVDEIDDNHVRQIAIPLLKNHTVQKKINDLALEANEKRYQAYLLEQEALQIMDRDVIYAKK